MSPSKNITVFCLNPCLEITFHTTLSIDFTKPNIVFEEINFEAGGKGINVSRILNQLRLKAHVLGFMGGDTGEMLQKMLRREEIDFTFYPGSVTTRASIILNSTAQNKSTVIRYLNSEIAPASIEMLLNSLASNNYSENHVFAVSGSSPLNFTKKDYHQIGELCLLRKIKIFIDSFEDKVIPLYSFSPFLCTPNIDEAENFLGFSAKTNKDFIKVLREFNRLGCQNVILKFGEDGALALVNNSFYEITTKLSDIKCPTGAGDALTAGLIYNDQHFGDDVKYLRESFKIALASLYCLGSGKIDLSLLKKIPSNSILIKKLSEQ